MPWAIVEAEARAEVERWNMNGDFEVSHETLDSTHFTICEGRGELLVLPGRVVPWSSY